MPKESESFNNDENPADMITYSQNSELEEVLISDEEPGECGFLSYEMRLNDKLRDLNLLEEGMTIQQKQELLAVVVASWETAEKEKTRREFIQEYMNASEAFCNDDIEFSFQESEEFSNDASLLPSVSSCLDVTLSVDSPNVSCYSGEYENSSFQSDFDMQHTGNEMIYHPSMEICENAHMCMKPYELENCSPREVKKSRSRRGRPRRGRSHPKQSVGVACVVNSHSAYDRRHRRTGELTSNLSEKEAIERSMSTWKPCMSPKDTPLVCSKRPWLDEKDAPPISSEEEYSKKILSLVKDFDLARTEYKEYWMSNRTLDKPYYCNRRAQFSKRLNNKLDMFDITVGVPLITPNVAAEMTNSSTATISKSEPFSRTSGGAFRYVKSHRERTNAVQNNFEGMTTRSGARYGLNASSSHQNGVKVSQKANETKVSTDISSSTEAGSSDSPSHLFNKVEVILDEKLPHFNNLRPGLSSNCLPSTNDAFDQTNDVNKYPDSSRSSGTKAKNHSFAAGCERMNHVAKSCSDSSDTSSVIDVETIGDDEIEEFILKRKLLQEYQPADKETSVKQSKRSRKSAS
ncbi:uncharacterized protein TNIN_195401 [Trichonephila inaurata madagascariensis]|uniref:Uncharacterized protein n=1 Tax=Trichonephila inaurata madagascariensis TaxID=2747483 RepID=A0A8X6Y9C3_9ARAC|nr:uncharacterized protein TNIN_195401 [Trichonephila inaurata madagascariensis]